MYRVDAVAKPAPRAHLRRALGQAAALTILFAATLSLFVLALQAGR
jgi:hypothetical protein